MSVSKLADDNDVNDMTVDDFDEDSEGEVGANS